MAVLFGLLMQNNPRNQHLLISALPGESPRQRLDSLIENARDFTTFYLDFAKKVAESQTQDREDVEADEGASSVWGANIGRVLRDTKGEAVAKDVITFLEDLRQRTSD